MGNQRMENVVPSSSLVLPPGCFVVPSKNASMYGKEIRDIHMDGFSMETDAVVRFSKSDNKVVAADLLVGVERYGRVCDAQRMISNLIEIKDNQIDGLGSLEVDINLADQVIFNFNLYWYKIIFKIICT